MLLREVKSNPYKVLNVFVVPTKNTKEIKSADIEYVKLTEFTIADRYSTGSAITKAKITEAFVVKEIVTKKELNKEKKKEEDTPVIIEKEEETEPKIYIEKLVDVPQEEIKTEPKKEEKKKEKVNLKEIDDRLLTIEDFLNSD